MNMLESWWGMAPQLLEKGTFLLLMASIASLLLRRASASVRHLVWVLALGALLALPAFEAFVPAWVTSRLFTVPAGMAAEDVPERVSATRRGTTPEPWRLTPPVAAFGMWVAGMLVCGWRWGRGMAKVARMRREAVVLSGHELLAQDIAAQLGLRRRVTLLLGRQGDCAPVGGSAASGSAAPGKRAAMAAGTAARSAAPRVGTRVQKGCGHSGHG
jgi:hypothetical protein